MLKKLNIDLSVCVIALTLFSRCSKEDSITPVAEGKKIIKAAVYDDAGCWKESIMASEKLLLWIGCSVVHLNARYINMASLDSFDIILVPGGDMYQYAQYISAEGKMKISNFVQSGGGYIGICGGAYFASERVIWRGSQIPMVPLALFPGTATGPNNAIVPYPNYGMCKIRIVSTSHPVTLGSADSMAILYYWGPELQPRNDSDITILGTYAVTGNPAMVAFTHGAGRVFLVGTHPEIEEDSDRDGINFGDELVEGESDWEILKAAVEWCRRR